MKKKLALILVSFSCFTAAQGASLLVDFSTVDGSQVGWETINGTGSPSGIFSGYTTLAGAGNISVGLSNIAFNRTYANGATGVNFPGTDLDRMYGDLLFRNNSGTPIDITIGGLLAGNYQITTHHLNAPNTPSRFNLDVQDADSPAFGQSAAADIAMGLGNNTTFNPTVITFDVVSNGTDPIILRMTDTFIGTGGNTGGWWGINGLEIVVIPEPSSAALLGLGALGLLLRRRR